MASFPETDARALGRGGIAALHRPTLSPAAPVAAGWSVQAGTGAHYLGSGLVTRRLQVCRAGRTGAWALGFDQLHSDVHREQEIAATLQVRRRGIAFGAAVGWREWHFLRHDVQRLPVVRAGIGIAPVKPVHLVWMVERQPRADGALRFVAGAAVDLERHLAVAVQVEREPSLPSRWRLGIVWVPQTAWRVLCGYDAGTSGFSTGLALRVRAWSVVCAAANHPVLGWSRAWQLEWRR